MALGIRCTSTTPHGVRPEPVQRHPVGIPRAHEVGDEHAGMFVSICAQRRGGPQARDRGFLPPGPQSRKDKKMYPGAEDLQAQDALEHVLTLFNGIPSVYHRRRKYCTVCMYCMYVLYACTWAQRTCRRRTCSSTRATNECTWSSNGSRLATKRDRFSPGAPPG